MSKTTKEKIEIMQAHEEGKQVEFRYADRNAHSDVWSSMYNPSWNWEIFDYRIKEPKYRPYKDTEEMISDFCERSGAKRSTMGEPFIWVKKGEGELLIVGFGKDTVCTPKTHRTMKELFDEFTYCDGSPIGKKE